MNEAIEVLADQVEEENVVSFARGYLVIAKSMLMSDVKLDSHSNQTDFRPFRSQTQQTTQIEIDLKV